MSDKQKETLTQFRRPVVHLPDQWLPDIEALPGELKYIAEAIEQHMPGLGVRLTLLLAQVFPAQHLYIRKADKFILCWRNSVMRALYDQDTVTAKELSSLTGLSERQVWSILSEPDSQEELKKKQMTLF